MLLCLFPILYFIFLFILFSFIARITSVLIYWIVVLMKRNTTAIDNKIKRSKEIDTPNKKLELTAKDLNREIEALIKFNELLVKKNNQLEIQNKMQEEFISIAAHELRTPIQSILGYSELLEMAPERSKQYATSIIRITKRLERLTQNILDTTRIESNSLQLDKQRFNLDDLLFLIIKEHQRQLEKDETTKDMQIIYENSNHDKKNVIIYADKERINQVISNLIENAIKFTTQGKITITVDKENKNGNDDFDKVTVSVMDTGSGIHQDILPKLFSKFASKSFQGTGLGLFISKSILDAHGCKIWAKNNPVGKGATFTFNLPSG